MPAGEPRRGKGVNWRRSPKIMDRVAKVQELTLAGVFNTEIARQLGIAESTVRLDQKRGEQLHLEQTADTIGDLRAEKIKQLSDLYQRALAAAEFDEATERAVVFGHDADGAPVYVERPDKGSVSFRGSKAQSLNVARQALMDQAKLMGIVIDKVETTVTVRQIVEDLVRDLGMDAEGTAGVIAQAEAIVKQMKAPR
jgi:hypothetical protein